MVVRIQAAFQAALRRRQNRKSFVYRSLRDFVRVPLGYFGLVLGQSRLFLGYAILFNFIYPTAPYFPYILRSLSATDAPAD